jgi:hypothetical protein
MGLGIVTIYLTGSRISIVAVFIGSIGVGAVSNRNKFLIIFFIGAIFITATPVLIDLINYCFNYRAGSSTTRIELYLYGIEIATGKNILFGLGHKPRIASQFCVPIGSHSTFIGAYVKTGLLGLVTIISFHISLLRLWYRNLNHILPSNRALYLGIGASLLSMSVWMLTEDIDAPQLVMFSYSVLIGLLLSITKGRIVMPEGDHKNGHFENIRERMLTEKA